VFNKQAIGYYRVNYDDTNWNALINALSSPQYKNIHVMNRAQLIDDAFALADAKYFDYERAFNVLKYLVYEDDYFPWYTANRMLTVLYEAFGEKNNDLNVSF
jgi:aminopeptidase N